MLAFRTLFPSLASLLKLASGHHSRSVDETLRHWSMSLRFHGGSLVCIGNFLLVTRKKISILWRVLAWSGPNNVSAGFSLTPAM